MIEIEPERPGRSRNAFLSVLLAGLLLLGSATAGAPSDPSTAPTPSTAPPSAADGTPVTPSAIHFEVLPSTVEPPLPHDREELALFLPRPPFETWDSVAVTSSAPCLLLGSLDDPGPGYVLVQRATALSGGALSGGASMPPVAPGQPAAGERCDAVLTARVTAGTETWSTAVATHLFRPAAAPYLADDVSASLSVSRLATTSRDPESFGRNALLLEVAVANRSAQPITLLGTVDPEGLTWAKGRAYYLPEGRYLGTVSELADLEVAGAATEIAVGQTERLALVFDQEAALAAVGGTLSVRPAALVRIGDEVYYLPLDRVSTSWGADLP